MIRPIRAMAAGLLAGLALGVSTTASTAPLDVAAGSQVTLNFNIPAVNPHPWPPYTGVTLSTGVQEPSAPSTAPVRGTWQVYSGLDGTGRLVHSADASLLLQDIFANDLRYGRFSVRLTLTQGSLRIDPTISAFRNVSREIGVQYGDATAPVSVSVVATQR